MNKPVLRRVLAASLAISTAAALAGCNEQATSAPAVAQAAAQPKTVAREECHDEVTTHTVQPNDKNQIAGTAIGAVIGGIVGNQVGGGDLPAYFGGLLNSERDGTAFRSWGIS